MLVLAFKTFYVLMPNHLMDLVIT